MPNSSTYLTVTGLSCERDQQCLFANLDMCVRAGEIWHIKGTNGTGKTSLLWQLVGLLPVEQGRIEWCANESTATGFIYIGHKLAIKDSLTANENLAWLSGLIVPTSTEQRYAALEKVGLRGYEETLASQLSVGQRRRLALARMHLNTTCVWVLDEPFSALDQQGVADQQQWYAQHVAGGGAVILTSHQDLQLDNVHPFHMENYKEVIA